MSLRFLKFCTVGASGVVVNLLFLALFSDVMALQVNIASALAIEISVNSNFFINEMWTFRDRHLCLGRGRRWTKFHLVSLGGGGIQWFVFIGCNILLAMTADSSFDIVNKSNGFLSGVMRAVTDPPEVGNWKYLSQLIGIGIATFWNYVINVNWTWARGPKVEHG